MSIPTWIIHLGSVAEWLMAMWLFWLLGRKLKNAWLKRMPLFMLPYMISGWCAIAYHITYDTADWLNVAQSYLTFIGSCCFALWSYLLLRDMTKVKSKSTSYKRKVIYPPDLATKAETEAVEEVRRG